MAQACDLLDQAARDVREFLVGHQKDRLELGIELPVGHHHGEFAGDVRQGTDSTDHDLCTEFSDKVDGQSIEGFHGHIGQMLCDLLDEPKPFFDGKEGAFFLIDTDTDDQVFVENRGSFDDM